MLNIEVFFHGFEDESHGQDGERLFAGSRLSAPSKTASGDPAMALEPFFGSTRTPSGSGIFARQPSGGRALERRDATAPSRNTRGHARANKSINAGCQAARSASCNGPRRPPSP